jgi:hypothetical protein
MVTKMKTCCCGCTTLKKGVIYIGVYDCLTFLADLIWNAIAQTGTSVFLIPDPSYYWLILLRLIGVEFLRAFIFLIALKIGFKHSVRLAMFIVRVLTIGLSIYITAFSANKFQNNNTGVLVYDCIFTVLDFYFAGVILSYYFLSYGEELSI